MTTLQAPSKLLRAKDGLVKTKQVRNRTQVWIQRRLFNMAISFQPSCRLLTAQPTIRTSIEFPRSLAPAVRLPSRCTVSRFLSFLRKSALEIINDDLCTRLRRLISAPT